MRANEFINEDGTLNTKLGNGIFLAIKVCDADQKIIKDFCNKWGIEPLPDCDYHMTLYKDKSTDDTSVKNLIAQTNINITSNISLSQYDHWGTFSLPQKNIFNAVYLILNRTNELCKLRTELLNKIATINNNLLTPSGKLRDKFKNSEFMPHVTFSFDNIENKSFEYKNEQSKSTSTMKLKTLLWSGRIKPPLEQITFDKIIIQPRDENYGKRE